MQIFIMRHGEAALNAASDSIRPLTHCGRHESRQIAAWLGRKLAESVYPELLGIEQILVSPYLRATQTLEIVYEKLRGTHGELVLAQEKSMPELTPTGDVQWVGGYLRAIANKGCATVLLVSHLPLVGYLVTELCPNETSPMFATSAIACVELDAQTGIGRLTQQINPSQLMVKV